MNRRLIHGLYNLIGVLGFVSSLLFVVTACTVGEGVSGQATLSVREVMVTDTPVADGGIVGEQEDSVSLATLAEHRWILAKIIDRGEEADISSFHPTFINFYVEPSAIGIKIPCKGIARDEKGYGYFFTVQGQNYEFGRSFDVILAPCNEIDDSQRTHLRFRDTSRFEMVGGSLVLIGDDIEIVLEKFPENKYRFLSDSLWSLSAIIHQGESVDLSALQEPTYFGFYTDRNFLQVTTPCSYRLGQRAKHVYEIMFHPEQAYEVRERSIPMLTCHEDVEDLWAELRVVDTFRYEVDGDEVRLLGDDIEIVLVREER